MATEIPFLVCTRDPEPLPSAVTGTDLYIEDNDGNALVYCVNPTGIARTIEYVREVTIGGDAMPNQEETIGANQSLWLGPLPPAVFNDVNDQAHILDASGVLQFSGLRH